MLVPLPPCILSKPRCCMASAVWSRRSITLIPVQASHCMMARLPRARSSSSLARGAGSMISGGSTQQQGAWAVWSSRIKVEGGVLEALQLHDGRGA